MVLYTTLFLVSVSRAHLSGNLKVTLNNLPDQKVMVVWHLNFTDQKTAMEKNNRRIIKIWEWKNFRNKTITLNIQVIFKNCFKIMLAGILKKEKWNKENKAEKQLWEAILTLKLLYSPWQLQREVLYLQILHAGHHLYDHYLTTVWHLEALFVPLLFELLLYQPLIW